MKSSSLFLSLLCLALVAPGIAKTEADQPKSFQLSHFKFDRPPAWEWVPSRTENGALLRIVDPKTQGTVLVVFAHYASDSRMGDRNATPKRWKGQFLAAPEPSCKTEHTVISNRKVTFVEVKGTRKGDKKEAHRDNVLFGAVIGDEEGNVLVKLVGPESLVEKCKADFRKMIEQALH